MDHLLFTCNVKLFFVQKCEKLSLCADREYVRQLRPLHYFFSILCHGRGVYFDCVNFKNFSSFIYPTKKETHHYDFPIKISSYYENVNCHEIFISDQILLKLECDVDEYLYLPFVSTKHIKANGKRVFEA